ncbi:type IV pilus secretin family protein [Gaopeijia maritima]|uniref:AMIN domain-containing protein n=1 Tax=Gaopeijia maritima TaxID=3119007 RepID=A0ABU9EFD3_9BACT
MTSTLFALATGLTLGLWGPVTEVSIRPAPSATTEIVIAVDGEVEYREFTMEGPSRLVVDLFGARHNLPGDNFADVNRGGVNSVRTSQYSDDVVRVVLELESLSAYDVVAEPGRIRVVMENPAGEFEPWTSGAGAPAESIPAETAPSFASEAAAPLPSSTMAARTPPQQEARRISVTFNETPIREVLFTFSDFSGRSIVAGSGVTGLISAQVDAPWPDALDVILGTNGFVATELPNGIIRVDDVEDVSTQAEIEPLVTEAYRVNYATAEDLSDAVDGLLTERGTVRASQSTNSIVVTDIAAIQREVERLIDRLDVRTPQVQIKAKIVFVNRTELNDLGIVYDLKDSGGNQLNQVTPGAADLDGDGRIELPDEAVQQGTNTVALGGNSVAALGNATNRVPSPTLSLLSSLLIGRHTLVSFIEALESVNLSDIQAEPSVTVRDNRPARIQVGERTPLRVLDASSQAAGGAGGGGGGGAGGQGGGAVIPQATVTIEETGIILEATPHVTDDDHILLELNAERSSPQLANSDVGYVFATQNAQSEVLVRDGETVVIAGLTVTEREEVRSGIPFLMNLPLVGGLFRTTRESAVQRDLIILVTPTIVRDN